MFYIYFAGFKPAVRCLSPWQGRLRAETVAGGGLTSSTPGAAAFWGRKPRLSWGFYLTKMLDSDAFRWIVDGIYIYILPFKHYKKSVSPMCGW